MTSDVCIRFLEVMYFTVLFEFRVRESLAKIVKKVGKVSTGFRACLCKLAEMTSKSLCQGKVLRQKLLQNLATYIIEYNNKILVFLFNDMAVR